MTSVDCIILKLFSSVGFSVKRKSPLANVWIHWQSRTIKCSSCSGSYCFYRRYSKVYINFKVHSMTKIIGRFLELVAEFISVGGWESKWHVSSLETSADAQTVREGAVASWLSWYQKLSVVGAQAQAPVGSQPKSRSRFVNLLLRS